MITFSDAYGHNINDIHYSISANCKDNDYFPRFYYNGKQTFKTCAEWAKMGKLKCNERFFLNNCRKTCKMCLGQKYAPQGPTSSRSKYGNETDS